MTIKESYVINGTPSTWGQEGFRNNVADKDGLAVQRFRAAGAHFLGKTNVPVNLADFQSYNPIYGTTGNPWDTSRTPGGSSGGSAAALAAGFCGLEAGSDIGGSIRYPASQCGLVGFKPPYGRVPETYAPFNLETYCANGPMARPVADTALMQNVMSGPHQRDAASVLPFVEIPSTIGNDLRGSRIAYSMDLGYLDPEEDVVRNTRAMLERLEQLGAQVIEIDLGWPTDIEWAYNAHMDPFFSVMIANKIEEFGDQMCDYNVKLTKDAMARLENKEAFFKGAVVESQMYASFGKLMTEFDALICPTVMSNKLTAGFNPAEEDYVVNGKVQDFDLKMSTCHIFNMMGRCPAISVPSGIGDNGVPTGLHIVSKAYDDIAVFRIAAAFEKTWQEPFRPAAPD